MKRIALLWLLSAPFLMAQPSERWLTDGIIKVRSVDFKTLEPLLHRDSDTTYVVNFWATWCGPCVKELPHFENIGEQYRDRKVKVILVSLDFPKAASDKLLSFIRRKGIRSEVVHLNDTDSNSWIPKVDPEWTGSIPATLIYRGQRRVFYEQAFDEKGLRQAVETFLNP